MGTVAGMFKTYEEADRAIGMLRERGFDSSMVGAVAQESTVTSRVPDGMPVHTPTEAGEGATEGAMVGGLAGLVLGVTALMIPGLGPLFVAGALASVVTSAVAGAAAGAAAGGVMGLLAEHGIPAERAESYAAGVRGGGVLITVQTPNEPLAASILREAGATDIHEGAMMAQDGVL